MPGDLWTQHALGGESGWQTIWQFGAGVAWAWEASSRAAKSALREAVMKFMVSVVNEQCIRLDVVVGFVSFLEIVCQNPAILYCTETSFEPPWNSDHHVS